MCRDPKKIRDPGFPGYRIRAFAGSWILYFHFLTGPYRSWILSRYHFRGILGILDLGQKENLLHPGDPGSSLSNLSWDLVDRWSYTTIMSLYFEHPLHQMKFCFWFPISMLFLNLSTVNNFHHTLIQPFCVGLETSSHWFLSMFSIIDVLLTGCGWREMNAHFIKT